MKKIITAALFACITFVAVNSLAAELINPSFELSGDGIAGWTSGAEFKEKYIAGVLDESYDTIGMCATLKNLGANHSYLVQRITGGQPGDCYFITAMAKVTGKTSGSGAGITAQSVKAGAGNINDVSSERLTEGENWQKLSLYVVLDKGIDQFDLYLELGSVQEYSDGEAYFDCVEIHKLDRVPDGVEAAVIKNSGPNADVFVITGVILCLVLAGIIAIRKGWIRRNDDRKDALADNCENETDEI